MSTTSIYAVKQDEEPMFLGECKNAFRGAMYVWSDIAKRYFNEDYFPHSNEPLMRRIWNAGDEKPLTECELIVLTSTMVNVMVKKSDIGKLLGAFLTYGKDHENSSIPQQLNIIGGALEEIKDGYSLAWIQTSVCEGWFKEWDEEKDSYICDISKGYQLFDNLEAD